MSCDVVMADAEACNTGELFVWPWTGILAMVTDAMPTDDDTAAVSILALHAQQHFAAVTTTALQEAVADHHHRRRRRRHFLVLHFGKSWGGLRDAMSLAGRFARAGRKEWRQQQRGESAGVVFGWTAGEEDLHGDDAVGRFLREAGAAARSTEDVERDEGSVAAKLGAMAGEYERRAKFLETKCEEMAATAQRLEEERSSLHDELKELRNIADKMIPEMNKDVQEENEKLKAELDATTKEMESKMETIVQLKDGSAKLNLECSNVQQGALEIKSLELAIAECKVGDHAPILHANHKQEMEAICHKMIQLEKQLERREALVLTIRQLNMKLQEGQKLRKEDHQHLYPTMICLRKILDDENERSKDSCGDLMKRERMNSEELQENRQELIQGLENMPISRHNVVGIKRMGELDEMPFHLACKRRYRDDDPEGKAARLVSSWQDEIKKPSWHPFTIIHVDGEDKEVVDEDDPKLRQLRIEYGDNVCNAVKVALSELNVYNPHERHVVNELWNFREGRKATTTEVVRNILEQLKTGS